MALSKKNERVAKSIQNLVKAGGRVVSSRITPDANSVLEKMLALHGNLSITECINEALTKYRFEDVSGEKARNVEAGRVNPFQVGSAEHSAWKKGFEVGKQSQI